MQESFHTSESPEGRHFVISGLSASGKTTLVGLLSANPETLIVPEHNDWIGGSQNFPKKPQNLQEKKAKQEFFIGIDLERQKWVSENRRTTKYIVADADFTAPLAHNYAERWLMPEFDIYPWLVEHYCELLRSKQLVPANLYFYLDATLGERVERRASQYAERKRNDMFFQGTFPDNMRKLYWILMHPDSPRVCLPCHWMRHSDSAETMAARVTETMRSHDDHPLPINVENLIEVLKSTIDDKPEHHAT